ncbi:MAG: ABC transporter ATP-binding protein [Pirellula sp.]|jgi:phospholipid/cholesterol/gamma-HCH transport system ATP-binding protein
MDDALVSQLALDQRPASHSLVQTENLCIQFGRQVVLKDVSIAIPRGQTVAIIGESGCGKTMFLKSLMGLIPATSGRVLFDGKDIHSLSEQEMTALRRRFGFVFQNAALFDSMNIQQNIAFPLEQHGVPKGRSSMDLIEQRLREVGLPRNVLPKRPSQLSGGMRKRVGLARALILEPELLLYDEPTTGLDPIMSDVINELIMRTRRKYSVTSIVVTHDMHSAKKVADRVIMLYPYSRLLPGESQILFDGTPEQLDHTKDSRVRQFVRGEAGERLMEMLASQSNHVEETPHLHDTIARREADR